MSETAWYVVTGYYMIIAAAITFPAGVAIGFAIGRFAIGGSRVARD